MRHAPKKSGGANRSLRRMLQRITQLVEKLDREQLCPMHVEKSG
jgi:hypothetical protein